MHSLSLNHTKAKFVLIGVLIAALFLTLGGPYRAQVVRASTTINVTTTDDELNSDGDCSLREAIRAANTDTAVDACPAGSGADTINLPAGNYTLSIGGLFEDAAATGDLDIGSSVTIQGISADTTIVNGNNIDRVFEISGSATSVTISNLTIRGGNGNATMAAAYRSKVALCLLKTASSPPTPVIKAAVCST